MRGSKQRGRPGTMAATREPTNGEPTPTKAEELVQRAKAGDGRAFEELVRRYRARIYALCLHLTGSRSDADDITQDVFVRAYRKLESFEGRSEFFTWLYRIAMNRAFNARRDGARRRTSDLDDPRVQAAVQVDASGDPRRQAELRQRYARLVNALDELSPTLKAAVVLVALQGLSHEEAGIILDCPSGTVAWRIHEARKQLRELVDPPSVSRPLIQLIPLRH
jgi:RNA polymerase sigma-70 factor, ECF subfamily